MSDDQEIKIDANSVFTFKGFPNMWEVIWNWPQHETYIRASVDVDCTNKQPMLKWLLDKEACTAGICWAICTADTLEEMWDALVREKRGTWLLWVAVVGG